MLLGVLPAIAPGHHSFNHYSPEIQEWEGEALVVTTININWPYCDNAGTPQCEASPIVERFTLEDEGTRLNYQMTLTDPYTFEEPATVERYMLPFGERIERFDCQPNP